EYMDTVKEGLIFTNLVDFDMLYGHRNDAKGYGKAIEEFNDRLQEIYAKMTDEDMLILTADHGCDPTTASTDHSREYIPILVYGKNLKGNVNLGTRETFADIGKTILDFFNVENELVGKSFLNDIRK
ncbi:MAG: phosphopentomutase, partial [Clostridium sp.]